MSITYISCFLCSTDLMLDYSLKDKKFYCFLNPLFEISVETLSFCWILFNNGSELCPIPGCYKILTFGQTGFNIYQIQILNLKKNNVITVRIKKWRASRLLDLLLDHCFRDTFETSSFIWLSLWFISLSHSYLYLILSFIFLFILFYFSSVEISFIFIFF